MVERTHGSTVGVPRCMFTLIMLSVKVKVCAHAGILCISAQNPRKYVLVCLFSNLDFAELEVKDNGTKTQWRELKTVK